MEQRSFQLGTGEAASKAAPGQHPGQTAPAPLLDAPQMHWIITYGERCHFHPCKSSFTYVFLNSIPVHLQVLQISTLICNSSASLNGASSNQSSRLYFQHAQDLLSRVPKEVKCKWGPVHLALPTLGVSQKLHMANTTVGFRPSTQPAVGQLSSPPPQKKNTNPAYPCTVASPSLLTSSAAPLYHLFNPNLSSVFEVFAAKWTSRICSQCKHIKNSTLLLYGAGSLPPTCSLPLTTIRWTKVWLPSFAIHLDFLETQPLILSE